MSIEHPDIIFNSISMLSRVPNIYFNIIKNNNPNLSTNDKIKDLLKNKYN